MRLDPEPPAEVHIDGRLYFMDGAFTGASASGQVERGEIGSSEPPIIMVPAATLLGPIDLSNEVGTIIPYRGEPPRYVTHEPVADVYWFETFMERLGRDLKRRTQTDSAANHGNS